MRLSTRLRSVGMRVMASQKLLHLRKSAARRRRQRQGQAPMILYFHQVDDPYSLIMAGQLQRFASHTTLPIKPYLVSGPEGAFQGDAERFAVWALNDAATIAGFLGEPLPIPAGCTSPSVPDSQQVAIANHILSDVLTSPDFLKQAQIQGQALWRHENLGTNPADGASAALEEGNRLRETLGHYLGGTLYFDGEWFWGADRLPRLWERLKSEGYLGKQQDAFDPYASGTEKPLSASSVGSAQITLEYFPSLRSPYTAIAHAAVNDLVNRSGVNLTLRPVMPMLMRGIPAPRAKQNYIITDCAREARAKGIAFGNFVDPFGEPVKRGFRLFPGALAQDKGMAFVGAFLDAAFANGTDIDSERGLRDVVTQAGLDWQTTSNHPDNQSWEELLEANLQAMLDAGLWGVPSFRVSSPGEADFCCWGQDRIWRVEHEIAQRSQATAKGNP